MKIKKFTAKDIKEGKRLVFEELGDDAVILSNRTFKDSNGNVAVEIVAAIDESINKEAARAKKVVKENVESTNVMMSRLSKQNVANNNEIIMGELDIIKTMISEISDNIKFKNLATLGNLYSLVYKKLRKLDINEEESLRIVNRLSNIGNIKEIDEAVYEARKILLEGIELGKTIQKSNKCRVILFVGTNGSGKTLTLVKLAIISKLIQNANSLIVSADSYKVGAAEQLETYSSIAGISYRTSYSNDELLKIISDNKTKDFIFVDSTGFTQKDKEQLSQITDLSKMIAPDIIYLTIPATISELNAKSVLSNLKSITIDGIIITKTDESETIASLLTAIKNYKLPISYLTSGVKIPDDIEPAEKVILGKLAIKD